MKCPVCEHEMEKGLVQFHRSLSWVKNKHKLSLSPQKGEIFIYQMNALSYICLEAYICKSCQKIVIDYSESQYHEG